jgi:hypothetical protein
MHPVDRALLLAGKGRLPEAQAILDGLTSVLDGLDAVTVRGVSAFPERALPEGLAALGRSPFDLLGRRCDEPQHVMLGDSIVFELAREDTERASRQELAFKNQLRAIGFDVRSAALVAAAFSEMQSNALEHSYAPVRPLACWRVCGRDWAFGVYDVGRGVLASLKEDPAYRFLTSHKEALELAVTDHVSSRGAGRGMGFHTLFKALLDRRSTVRMRTGNIAAHFVGHNPTRQDLKYTILPDRAGFCMTVSVTE